MARIKFGSVIVDSRGSIGGHSLKMGRSGNVLLKKPQPLNRLTEARALVNARFAALSKSWWADLDSTQRTAWRELAAANPSTHYWGDEFASTGLAYYIKLNQRLGAAGVPGLLDAPGDQTVTSPATLSFTIPAPSTVTVNFSASPIPTNHVGYLWITPPKSPGIANVDGSYLYLHTIAASATSPWDASSAFTQRFGNAITDRAYFSRLAFLNTTNGALSPYLLAQAIAA